MNKALFAFVALYSLALTAVGCGPRNTFGVVDVTGKITVDGGFDSARMRKRRTAPTSRSAFFVI